MNMMPQHRATRKQSQKVFACQSLAEAIYILNVLEVLMEGLEQTYDRRFYEITKAGSLGAAEKVLTILRRYRPLGSVVDVGCGIGTWLAAALQLGATEVLGLEGFHVPQDMLLMPANCLQRCDLSSPFNLGARFDLCLCLEVAEHLPPDRAPSLVNDLVRTSAVIVFSAAIPYQGGDGHVNEAWPETWATLFRDHGYVPWDGLRKLIWSDQAVPWWYRQNLLVFVDTAVFNSRFPGETHTDHGCLSIIHPESYLWNVHRPGGRLRSSYVTDVNTYYDSINGRRSGIAYGPEFPAPRPDDL